MKKLSACIITIAIFIISLPVLVTAAPPPQFETKQRNYGKINMVPETLPSTAVFVVMPPGSSNPTMYAEQVFGGIKDAFEKTGRMRVLPMQQTQKVYRHYARNKYTPKYTSADAAEALKNARTPEETVALAVLLTNLQQREDKERNEKYNMADDGYFNFIPKEQDFLTIGENSGADYAMFISVKVNRQDAKANPIALLTLGILPVTSPTRTHQTALWDIILVNNNTGEFVLDEAVTDIQGTSGLFVTTDRVFTKIVEGFVNGLDFDKLPLDGEYTEDKPFFQSKEKEDDEEETTERTYSIANGQLGTPSVLVYNDEVATWTTYDIAYNPERDRIVIRGSFTNNTSNYITRVRNMSMNIILMDNNNKYIRVFSTKFGNHDINIRPHGQKDYTYIIRGIPYTASYSGNFHITYTAQYFVRRPAQ